MRVPLGSWTAPLLRSAFGLASLFAIAAHANGDNGCGVPDGPQNKVIVHAAPSSGAGWQAPGSPSIPDTFPCSAGTCTLDSALRRTAACALVVVQRGKLVYEYYRPGQCKPDDEDQNGPTKRYGVASITKSVVSTLFGFEKMDPTTYGSISLDSPISDYVSGLPAGTHVASITFRQALLMRSAPKYNEHDNCLWDWTTKNAAVSKSFVDAASYYSGRNPWQTPGQSFYYAGLNPALVGLAIEAIAAKARPNARSHLNDLLSDLVWTKAGMEHDGKWATDRFNTPNPFCCLNMTARDLAHFGQFVLQNWKATAPTPETPLVPWMRQATEGRRVNDSCEVLGEKVQFGYGYLWWTYSGAKNGFAGLGVYGQFLHVFPEQDVVVAQLSSWNEEWNHDQECDSYAIHRLVADHQWQ